MTKYMIAAAAVAALLAPTTALAQDGTVNITGTVAAKCVIATAATITLNELADTDGLYNNVANGKTATLNAWCNGAASKISVLSNAITLQAGPAVQPGFTGTVNFTATATVDPAGPAGVVSVADSTTGAADAAATVGLFSDAVTVTLSSSSTNGGKMIAGSYAGSVVVTLAPAA